MLRPVCLRDIRDALLEHAPQIVHFSEHEIKTEGFAIADDVGEIKLVTTDELKSLFMNFSTIKCVILNAGFSQQQSNAIVQHINYVIDLNLAIGHKTAIEFIKAFYAKRGAGISIEDSYGFGCDSIKYLQNLQKNFAPVIKKKTKPENLTKYCTEVIRLRINHYGKNDAQLYQMYRTNLEQCRLNLQLLQEEAFDIENDISELFTTDEIKIKEQIKNYKKYIKDIRIDECTDKIPQEPSDFQNYIGLGEEAVDETGKRVGDEIISKIYIEVVHDLLYQEQLSQKQLTKAQVFLEEAARLDKNNPLVYEYFAYIWFEIKKYNKALVELNKAKRLFVQKKMLVESNKIDLYINRIPISSRIRHLIDTVFGLFIK